MATNQKLFPVLCLLVGLALGFIGADMLAQKNMEAFKARIVGSGLIPLQAADIKQLSGSITSLSGNTLVVAVRPVDPFGDPSLDERNVTIDSTTKITLMVPKDPAVFKKELEAFQSALQKVKPGTTSSSSALPTPPQFFERKAGDSSSLSAGQIVNITTAENVKDQKNFVALAIEVLSAAVPPAISQQ